MTEIDIEVEDLADEDGFTSLEDVDCQQVDAVGAAANGTAWFFSKSQPGIVPAELVRDLIKQADGDGPGHDPEVVTMATGSPRGVAEAMRAMAGAPVRTAAQDAAERLAKAARAAQEAQAAAALVPFAKGEYEALVKAKYNADQLKEMAGNGHAMPDESYPIEDSEDVHNAVRAVGRGENNSHAAIRRHVMARARALGESSQIPDTWSADGSLKEPAAVAKADADEGTGSDPLLAEPEGDTAPGSPTDPGSPAWEQIDAATARMWTSQMVRVRSALQLMSQRESIEAASADPSDALAAAELQDAICAADFIIDTLAGFAVDEQAEADCGSEHMAAMTKSLRGLDPAAVEQLELFGALCKSGRPLTGARLAQIRAAFTAVRNHLPAPPEHGRPVVKEEAMSTETIEKTEAATDTTAAAEVEKTTTAETETAAAAEPAEVEKAKGEQVLVHDGSGRPVGTVASHHITPVKPVSVPADEAGADSDAGGTDARVIPGTHTVQAPPAEEDVTKSTTSETAALTEVLSNLAKQLETNAAGNATATSQLAEVVKGLQERVAHVEAMPDDRNSPRHNAAATGASDELTQLRKAVEADPGNDEARRQLAFAEIKDRFNLA
jgi:hypothetical protein